MEDEAAKAKKLRATKLANTSIHKLHLERHPRRSHRPLIAKGTKGQRMQKEEELKAQVRGAQISKESNERIRLLLKLIRRQEAAGDMDAVAATRDQIQEIKSSCV